MTGKCSYFYFHKAKKCKLLHINLFDFLLHNCIIILMNVGLIIDMKQ